MAARGSECVQVVVRCRPLFGKELAEGRQRIVDMDTETGQVDPEPCNPTPLDLRPHSYTPNPVYKL
jgi:kinesin family protein 3/17